MALLACLFGCDGFEYGFSDPDQLVPDDVWVTERLFQNQAPAVDVLFVMDGTGSMAEELQAIRERASAFVDVLDELGVSWQMGAITTDLSDAGVLNGRPWIITPSTPAPAEALALILDVGSTHLPPSAGLDAAAMALDPATDENLGFRRENAALHIVFVSDDDDQSGTVLGADPVSGFLAFLAEESARSGQPARASAVVGDVPAGCTGETGVAKPGTGYDQVAVASGGTVASICNVDFTVAANAIGATTVDWPTVFSLQAPPAAGTVTAQVDGVRTSDFVVDYDAPSIVFDEAPPALAEIEVRYQVAAAP